MLRVFDQKVRGKKGGKNHLPVNLFSPEKGTGLTQAEAGKSMKLGPKGAYLFFPHSREEQKKNKVPLCGEKGTELKGKKKGKED